MDHQTNHHTHQNACEINHYIQCESWKSIRACAMSHLQSIESIPISFFIAQHMNVIATHMNYHRSAHQIWMRSIWNIIFILHQRINFDTDVTLCRTTISEPTRRNRVFSIFMFNNVNLRRATAKEQIRWKINNKLFSSGCLSMTPNDMSWRCNVQSCKASPDK